MSTSRTLLIRIYPELQYEGTTILDAALAQAALQISSAAFGTQYEYAAVSLAAHMVEWSKRGAEGSLGAGAVTGQTGSTISYAQPGPDVLNATRGGREFLRIRRLVTISMNVT